MTSLTPAPWRCSCFLLLACCQVALAQGSLPVGSQFQVNSYTTEDQLYPAVALRPGGGFVVVWASGFQAAGSDGDLAGIAGQLFDAEGVAQGPELVINSYTTDDQRDPKVAVAPDGDFVVVWESTGSAGTDTDYKSVQGQRYTSDGTPAGFEFQINTFTSGRQRDPSVGVATDGSFVVVWENLGSVWEVSGQRFASDGTPLGGEFVVNTYTTDGQQLQRIAVAPDGDFVVVWQSDLSPTDPLFSIQGQRFDSSGTLLGAQFQVNTYTTNLQRRPAVAMAPDGRFVVAWYSHETGVSARRFAADGTPFGDEISVEPAGVPDPNVTPEVSVDQAANFMVVWAGTDGSSDGIQGRQLDAQGLPLTGAFVINTYTTDFQSRPRVATRPGDGFVVVWHSVGSSGSDNDALSVHGQRFDSIPVFADGFEGGDTAPWSQATP